MAASIAGEVALQDQQIAIVVSRFNRKVTEQLLAGAEAAYLGHGGHPDKLTKVWVPGSFELPATARRLGASGHYAGLLTLGAIIKGDTLHFEVLAHQVTRALLQVSIDVPVPLSFGVLTTLSVEQALERADPQTGNKGGEAMESLIELISLNAKLAWPAGSS
ncbi:MAG: 6,7-dimethyl-8-ribityllumazine synthase [Candidatus Marinimicrobia bacterium]|nr:6,7-dimethyl-8-ribityllumazine synthase [Candidatus Neomarinimicrobiota bacterium]